MTETDTKPPWVLFCEGDKPLAILPAGRPGEICTTEGWSKAFAQAVVDGANRASASEVLGRLQKLRDDVRAATEELKTEGID